MVDPGILGAAQGPGGPDAAPRLPQLREPLGWRSLDERELAVRTTQLLDAAMADPPAHDFTMTERAMQGPMHARAPSAKDSQAPDADALPSSVTETARRWGRLAGGLPWLVGVGGFTMSVPVLIWAPLLGGLCLGLVGLQIGLMRGWVHQRRDLDSAQALLQGEQAHSTVSERKTPPGLLLAGFLAVFSMLAGLVIYTAALKSREPASVAEIIRAQHQAARAEKGRSEKDQSVQEPTKIPR